MVESTEVMSREAKDIRTGAGAGPATALTRGTQIKSASAHRSVAANAVYRLLNPIPLGFFIAALIFDVIYVQSGEVLWVKSAAWLIAIGLVFAVIPRLINLVQVWVTSRRAAVASDRVDFWLNLMAIAAAIVNSFVHSRDAYGVVPAGVWLSALTVLLLCIGNLLVSVRSDTTGGLYA